MGKIAIKMKWLWVFTFLIHGLGEMAYGQNSRADCAGSIEIEGNSVYLSKVDGPGAVLEIQGNELGNLHYFTEEHNTAWFIVVPPYHAIMSMTLVPDDPNDDWDFMIYQPTHVNYCEQIRSGELLPVRSNLSRTSENEQGKTGLKQDAESHFQPAGLNPPFSSVMEVKREHILILVVDIKEFSGHGARIDFEYEKVQAVVPAEIPVVVDDEFQLMGEALPESTAPLLDYRFEFYDGNTGQPLVCDVELVGVVREDSVMGMSQVDAIDVKIPEDSRFYLNVRKKDYLFNAEKYKALSAESGLVHKIELLPMEAGNRIVLQEIVFRENTTHLLPTSYNALEQLKQFMEEYPTASIEIQGHVNAPGYENEGKVKKFSLKRAVEIKEFLVGEGIDGRRMKVRGMGNEFMIYPTPTTYQEEKANRRVEIEVLSLGQ